MPVLGGGGASFYLTLTVAVIFLQVPGVPGGNPDAKRLYDDLLSDYNKLVRPVVNVSEAVTVRLKLKLSQLIDVVSHQAVFHLPFPKKRWIFFTIFQLALRI